MEAVSVPLRRSGLVALVDADQFESLHTFTRRDGESVCVVPSAISWRGVKSKGRVYAACERRFSGKPFYLSLHRLVMDAPAGMLVDHANGDTLDNRRINLRLCNHSQNAANAPGRQPSKSGFRGVWWQQRRWLARIQRLDNGCYRKVYLGSFRDIEQAARAHDAAARIWFGDFAVLNFPDLPPIELPAKILAKLPAEAAQ